MLKYFINQITPCHNDPELQIKVTKPPKKVTQNLFIQYSSHTLYS